jgi:hypothetical protein
MNEEFEGKRGEMSCKEPFIANVIETRMYQQISTLEYTTQTRDFKSRKRVKNAVTSKGI